MRLYSLMLQHQYTKGSKILIQFDNIYIYKKKKKKLLSTLDTQGQ